MKQPGMSGDTSAVDIQQLTFRSDGAVEITYMEQRDQSEGMGLIRVLIFDRSKAGQYVEEIEQEIRDLIDEMLIKLRGTPEMIPASRVPDAYDRSSDWGDG